MGQQISFIDPEDLEELNRELNRYSHLLKLTILGDSGVGKTSLLNRFVKNEFNEDEYTTIGAAFATKVTKNDTKKPIKLQIWEIGGKYPVDAYIRGHCGFFLVFDLTSKESFINLLSWKKRIDDHAREGAPLVLIGNKADLPERKVTMDEIMGFCDTYQAQYFETSAKLIEMPDTQILDPFLSKCINFMQWK